LADALARKQNDVCRHTELVIEFVAFSRRKLHSSTVIDLFNRNQECFCHGYSLDGLILRTSDSEV